MKPDTDIKHLNYIYAMKEDEQKEFFHAVELELKENPITHLDTEWGALSELHAGSGDEISEEEIFNYAAEILSKMTLRQKVNQMSADIYPKHYKVLYPRYNCKPYYAGEDKELGIPAIKFSDGPSGIVCGYNSTAFPVPIARGASFDIDLEERIGNVIGIEGRCVGANFFGGVCINLLRHPSWGRAQETYGEDTYLLGQMGSALIRGVQKHMMACTKHFALNSMENARFKVNVKASERTLREVYLPHFRECVRQGTAAVMSAYNKFRGKWCGHNEYLLRKILKEEWGFEGFVMSDFIWGIRDTEEAIKGGLDVEMPVTQYYGDRLVDAVEAGLVDEKLIDDAVLWILKQKIRFSGSGDALSYSSEKLGCREHAMLSKEACLKSTVLLKNENNILPLDVNKVKKITVVGRLARERNIGDMKGSSAVFPPYVVTPLEGLSAYCAGKAEVQYVSGEVPDEVTFKCTSADAVIIVAGLTYRDEGEYIVKEGAVGGDRENLHLSDTDVDIIETAARANPNCIVCLEGGSAIIIDEWEKLVRGIMMLWYPGMEGGNALAELIFGDVSPCAKLPVTIPKSPQQLPYFDKNASEIEYDFYHGYFLADKMNYDVAYHFGYGLSYANFVYGNAHCSVAGDNAQISVEVGNTSGIAADEIVQLYIGYVNSSVERHKKDLKGFKKVNLQPGQVKKVVFSINKEDVMYYDEQVGSWKFEDIDYIAYIGSSSRESDLIPMVFRF
jgi:beta-glucosidase